MGISSSTSSLTTFTSRAATPPWTVTDGTPVPLGVTRSKTGFNFSLYSKNATQVSLVLYAADDLEVPLVTVAFDQFKNRTGRVWHAGIPANGVAAAAYYAYRCDGPLPDGNYSRHAFKAAKLLLDPYATGVYFPESYKRGAALGSGSNAGQALLGVLPREPEFDWGNDARPLHDDLILYEMHVRGFTRNPNSGLAEEKLGSFLGVAEKIPHLQKLGINAVELLPVFEFDESEPNYWGYQPIQFFAPHHGYATAEGKQVREFKEMVKALHAAGIEVILDVVYNHTGEGNEFGPTFSLKGIDSSSYYMDSLDPAHPYADHTGTGNTLYCAGAAARELIVASLRYWAREMHVDGFRFDLATVFTLNQDGSVNLNDPAIFADIAMDPDLASVRLIAEPWGADYTYELGRAFPGSSWRQWNDRFRSTIRRFAKGDNGCVADAINRVYGSRDDLFPDTLPDSCRPFQSLNYITSHDGLTLYDQVAYTRDSQQSWNCGGPDGETGVSPEVMQLRKQQVKNFLSLVLLSNGTAMFRMGDEFLQTQNGQDNPYDVDDETTWLNWGRLADNPDIFRFFQKMIAFRKSHPSIASPQFWRDNVKWYGVGSGANTEVDYSDSSHAFAYCLHGASRSCPDIYVMINTYWEPLQFTICEGAPDQWRGVVDTGKTAPDDFIDEQTALPLNDLFCRVQPRSIVVLTKGGTP